MFIFINSVYSQDLRILEKTNDFREKVLVSEGREQLVAYLELIEYLSLNQPDKALLEKDSIISLAERLNDKKALIDIYLTLGECYAEIHKNELASEYFEKGLSLSKKIKDSSKIAESFIKIGKMKIPSVDLDSALNCFDNALKISEKNNDIQNQILAINYLGILNYILDDLQEAEKLSFKGLKLSERNNFLDGIRLANEHLAIIRIKQGKYKEALEFNKKAFDISQKMDYWANYPAVYYNYAVIYNRMGDFDKAIEFMNESGKIRKSYADFRGMGSDLSMLGRIYLAKKDYSNAIKKFLEAKKILEDYNAIRPLVSVLSGLSTAYENLGDYKTALGYFKEFKIFSDSVYNENVKRQTAILNLKRQIEEKDREIKYLEEINRVQSKVQNYLIIFSSIILVLFISSIVLYIKVRKSKQNLAEINKKLVSLNNEREKFFSIISHDLKSPFLGILGLIELLKEETNKSDNMQLKNLVDKLENAVNNQFKLVDDLLNWTRLQSGKMVFEPTEFILTDVLNESIESLRNFSLKKNIRIKTEIEKDFLVRADRNMISSVIRNLLSNAIKYSFTDTDINVLIYKKNDDFVSVQIKDNGIGIPEENILKLFSVESNISTEGTQKEKGTGLGLLMVKEMIEKNNGEIIVKSKLNLGSTFEFSLPIARK